MWSTPGVTKKVLLGKHGFLRATDTKIYPTLAIENNLTAISYAVDTGIVVNATNLTVLEAYNFDGVMSYDTTSISAEASKVLLQDCIVSTDSAISVAGTIRYSAEVIAKDETVCNVATEDVYAVPGLGTVFDVGIYSTHFVYVTSNGVFAVNKTTRALAGYALMSLSTGCYLTGGVYAVQSNKVYYLQASTLFTPGDYSSSLLAGLVYTAGSTITCISASGLKLLIGTTTNLICIPDLTNIANIYTCAVTGVTKCAVAGIYIGAIIFDGSKYLAYTKTIPSANFSFTSSDYAAVTTGFNNVSSGFRVPKNSFAMPFTNGTHIAIREGGTGNIIKIYKVEVNYSLTLVQSLDVSVATGRTLRSFSVIGSCIYALTGSTSACVPVVFTLTGDTVALTYTGSSYSDCGSTIWYGGSATCRGLSYSIGYTSWNGAKTPISEITEFSFSTTSVNVSGGGYLSNTFTIYGVFGGDNAIGYGRIRTDQAADSLFYVRFLDLGKTEVYANAQVSAPLHMAVSYLSTTEYYCITVEYSNGKYWICKYWLESGATGSATGSPIELQYLPRPGYTYSFYMQFLGGSVFIVAVTEFLNGVNTERDIETFFYTYTVTTSGLANVTQVFRDLRLPSGVKSIVSYSDRYSRFSTAGDTTVAVVTDTTAETDLLQVWKSLAGYAPAYNNANDIKIGLTAVIATDAGLFVEDPGAKGSARKFTAPAIPNTNIKSISIHPSTTQSQGIVFCGADDSIGMLKLG